MNNTVEIIKKAEGKFLSVVKESKSTLLWEQEKTFALQAISGNDALKKCSEKSIVNALVNISLTGLTLNPKKAYCYLIPRKGQAVLDISYQGMIYMMTNQLNIKSIHSEVVYTNDFFEYYTDENSVKITHKPNVFSKDRGDILGVYAIAYNNDGGSTVAVLKEEEIQQIKSTSQAAGTSYSPWSQSETIQNEMRKKTAIRRLWKTVPKSDKINEASEGIRIFDENHDAKFKQKESDLNNVFEEAELVDEETNKAAKDGE